MHLIEFVTVIYSLGQGKVNQPLGEAVREIRDISEDTVCL